MDEVKEAKIKKPIYKKWWFWVIIIFIILAAAGSQGEDITNINTKESNISRSSTQKEKTNQTKEYYSIGESGLLGDGSITVTKIEKSNGSQYDKPKSGKEYIIVYLTIANKGDSNLSYNPFYFKMQNSQGQQENETFSIINNDTALSSGELIPGGTVSGTLIFEQPINDSDLTLIYSDNFWSSKELKIKLQ